MAKWDYSEYFDENGEPRHGLPSKKPSFFGKLFAAIKRLVLSVTDFITGERF